MLVGLNSPICGVVGHHRPLQKRCQDWWPRRVENEPCSPRRRSAAAAGLTATQELYRQFWSEFEPVAKHQGWTNASASGQNWWSMPTGVSGAAWTVSYAMFGCRSELYFGHPDPDVNLARWQRLNKHKNEIVAAFGEGLIFDDLPNNKGCRIEVRLPGPKVSDRERWPGVITWMIDTQTRLRHAVSLVGGLLATTVTAACTAIQGASPHDPPPPAEANDALGI
jgi:hypothetical protein